jgi:hypothetical protein
MPLHPWELEMHMECAEQDSSFIELMLGGGQGLPAALKAVVPKLRDSVNEHRRLQGILLGFELLTRRESMARTIDKETIRLLLTVLRYVPSP